MKKQWWVLLALLLVGLASVSTISARTPEDKSDINTLAVRVADFLGLDHGVVGEAFTQAKQDIHEIALTKRLERARTTLDNLVATGDMTRADADAKLAAMSDLPLKKQNARRGKGKPLSIGLEAKLDAMVTAGEISRADADAKLAAMSDLPLKKQSARRGKGKSLPIALEAKLDAMVTAGEISRADADAKLAAMSDLPLQKQGARRGKGKSGSVVGVK